MTRVTEKGTLRPTKGDLRGHRWIIFDAATRCQAEDCPLFTDCPYEKVGKCTVETKYTTAIFDSICDEIGDKLNQRTLNKISLHLFPLYSQLIKMKKVALGITNPTYNTVQGAKKIHPIFREIREVIKSLESTQRSMGIDGEYSNARTGFGNGGGEGSGWESNPREGDGDYADVLFKIDKPKLTSEVFPEGTGIPKRSVKK